MVHLPDSPRQTTADFESYQDRRQFLSTAAMGIASAGAATLFSVRPAPAAESSAASCHGSLRRLRQRRSAAARACRADAHRDTSHS